MCPTVLFCTGVDDTRICMGKLGKLDTVLFTDQALIVAAFFDMVDLYRFVTG